MRKNDIKNISVKLPKAIAEWAKKVSNTIKAIVGKEKNTVVVIETYLTVYDTNMFGSEKYFRGCYEQKLQVAMSSFVSEERTEEVGVYVMDRKSLILWCIKDYLKNKNGDVSKALSEQARGLGLSLQDFITWLENDDIPYRVARK